MRHRDEPLEVGTSSTICGERCTTMIGVVLADVRRAWRSALTTRWPSARNRQYRPGPPHRYSTVLDVCGDTGTCDGLVPSLRPGGEVGPGQSLECAEGPGSVAGPLPVRERARWRTRRKTREVPSLEGVIGDPSGSLDPSIGRRRTRRTRCAHASSR